MRSTLGCALLGACVASAVSSPWRRVSQQPRAATGAALGTQELAGGTLEIPFDVQSVTPFETSGHLTGSVTSKLSAYRSITGLTLALTSTPPESRPPSIAGGTVKSRDMKLARIPRSNGTPPVVRVDLRDAPSDGFPVELTIHLAKPATASGAPACESFTLQITPSTTCAPGGECDVLPTMSAGAEKPSYDARLARPGCRAVVVPIRNAGTKPAPTIRALRGAYAFGEPNALAGAWLLDKIEGPATAGAKATVEAEGKFAVAGAAIPPGDMRYLVLQFRKAPIAPTTLSVQATLAD